MPPPSKATPPIFGDRLILKLFRRQQAGPNPDCGNRAISDREGTLRWRPALRRLDRVRAGQRRTPDARDAAGLRWQIREMAGREPPKSYHGTTRTAATVAVAGRRERDRAICSSWPDRSRLCSRETTSASPSIQQPRSAGAPLNCTWRWPRPTDNPGLRSGTIRASDVQSLVAGLRKQARSQASTC